MRAVIQRVINASVIINDKIYSTINNGLLILLGISPSDKDNDIDYIIDKIINLRIFRDNKGKMNESIGYINGEILIVSQFTLFGDVRKGRRPSYTEAAKGEEAESMYNIFINKIKAEYYSNRVQTGKFGAMMKIELINDGPVTILLDSERKF